MGALEHVRRGRNQISLLNNTKIVYFKFSGNSDIKLLNQNVTQIKELLSRRGGAAQAVVNSRTQSGFGNRRHGNAAQMRLIELAEHGE